MRGGARLDGHNLDRQPRQAVRRAVAALVVRFDDDDAPLGRGRRMSRRPAGSARARRPSGSAFAARRGRRASARAPD